MITFLENKEVQGIPYLKIDKLSKFRFMFFDRYEIHIQAFLYFINENNLLLIIISTKIFSKYVLILPQEKRKQTNVKMKHSKTRKMWYIGHTFVSKNVVF